MFKFIKFTFLGLFFGVLPVALIAVITFTGFKIYNENKIKYNLSGIVLDPKSLNLSNFAKIEPKSNLGSSANTNQIEALSSDQDILQNSQNLQEVAGVLDKKVELPASVLLDIPLMMQEYSLNCEATSLAMALRYRGLKVTPQELQSKVGYAEPVRKTFKNGLKTWGDPNLGFVGNEKGFLFTRAAGLAGGNGWGVNNGPIARVANEYRTGSLEVDGATIENIKQALAQDKPVIFWHMRDDARSQVLTYQTPEGKEIKMFQNHVNLLIGYNTDSKGNVRYIFNDPIYGIMNMSQKDMLRYWGKFNNEIVIVN